MVFNSQRRESESSGGSIKRLSLNTIDSSVTRLLVSTKHLLESLTQWARQEADDKYVSDAYVKLGNDFRAAVRAFNNSGIDISDIGDVPQALRIILEAALSEEPSQENLDRFLPNIRNIIVTLLQNLKAKQAKAKAMSQEIQMSELASNKMKESPKVTRILSTEAKDSMESKTPRNDALSQLQKGDALQRRASKRFSAYQYAKLTNSSVMNNALPRIDSETSTVRQSFLSKTNQDNKDLSNSIGSKPSGESCIFLKLNNKTRRANVKFPISLPAIRLLFVEKFAYSPGSTSFPDVYIQDPNSGVTYELEEYMLEDLKSGTLLCLNEPSSESKLTNDLVLKIEQLSKRIDLISVEVVSEMKESISAMRTTSSMSSPTNVVGANLRPKSSSGIKDLQSIDKDLRAIRQSHTIFHANIKEVIQEMGAQLVNFQERGLDISKDSNRAYMESCHSKLSEDSDLLLTKVDDLQDIMEELRKDVAQRGVRVGEKQLKHTSKEIEAVKLARENMASYIEKEKAVWKKIWEAELDKVCEEQQFFNLQDDLTRDLEEDIKKIEETFTLIDQCSSEQNKNASSKRNKVIANLHIPEPGESLHDLKGAVLNQVAALQPDHERRLEAIERAEKIREKERQMMNVSQFQEELGDFVEDNKLKKSGGIMEVERQRMEKDQENLKSSFGVI